MKKYSITYQKGENIFSVFVHADTIVGAIQYFVTNYNPDHEIICVFKINNNL